MSRASATRTALRFTAAFLIAACFAFASSLILRGSAYALEGDELSDESFGPYAVYCSDGYLWQADAAGNPTSKNWGDAIGNDVAAKCEVFQVDTLFVAADVEALPARMKVAYGTNNKETTFAFTDTGIVGDEGKSLMYVTFLTGESGVNKCKTIAPGLFSNATVDDEHFQEMINLISVTGLESTQLTAIPDNLFAGCDWLLDVQLPPTISSIGNFAFWNCSSLETDLSFGDGLESIGTFAFSGCRQLCATSNVVDLPASVNSVGESAFDGCWNVKKVLARNGKKVVFGSFALAGIDPLDLYVPNSILPSYLAFSEEGVVDPFNGAEIRGLIESSPIPAAVYTGSPLTPVPLSVTWAGEPMAKADYAITYANNIDPGVGTATITGKGSYQDALTLSFTITSAKTQAMVRLYNPYSGEHFYTSSSDEADQLVAAGWKKEGEGWKAPTSGASVYRLYNPYAGEHHFTSSADERTGLLAAGWKDEGVGWCTAGNYGVKVYRQYNPNELANNHNYTTSKEENDWLVSLGWRAEGIGWYGAK